MKSRDLKPAYTWESRRTVLQDGILFIPKFYQKHEEFGKLDFSQVFGNHNPVIVEYCSGNGSWIAQKAQENPNQNWIAVEKKFERASKVWAKMKNGSLSNLFVVYGDAFDFTEHYLKEGSIAQAYVNFPDPWPKDKHAKHRLFQERFLLQLKKSLQPGGSLTVATDDETYTGQICQEISTCEGWSFTFPSPHYIHDWEGYGTSFFEILWRAKGKQIYYMQFAIQ